MATHYAWVVQQYWDSAYGFEDVYVAENLQDGRDRLVEYLTNQPDVPTRLIYKRVDKSSSVREQQADYQLPLLTIEQRLAIKPIKHKAKYSGQDITYVSEQIQYLHKRLSEMLVYARPADRPAVHAPASAVELVRPVLEPLQHEELWVVLLDTRNRVLKMCQLYKGSANSSQVRIGEIFREAIREQATSIIVVHNHPSGDPTPSPEDIATTRSIYQAGKLLDIELLDHLVIGRDRFVSLKERGLGFG
jgi:DNA repair protein RadC